MSAGKAVAPLRDLGSRRDLGPRMNPGARVPGTGGFVRVEERRVLVPPDAGAERRRQRMLDRRDDRSGGDRGVRRPAGGAASGRSTSPRRGRDLRRLSSDRLGFRRRFGLGGVAGWSSAILGGSSGAAGRHRAKCEREDHKSHVSPRRVCVEEDRSTAGEAPTSGRSAGRGSVRNLPGTHDPAAACAILAPARRDEMSNGWAVRESSGSSRQTATRHISRRSKARSAAMSIMRCRSRFTARLPRAPRVAIALPNAPALAPMPFP